MFSLFCYRPKQEQGFPLDLLPHSLKISVFEYQCPEELLKFLEINQEHRHFVLSHGPFQRRLRSIRIDSVFGATNEVTHLKITLTTDDSQWFQLKMNQDQKDFTLITCHQRQEILVKRSNSRLLQNLPYCRELCILVDQPSSMRSGVFSELLSFIPRLDGRYLNELYLFLYDNRQGAAILEVLKAQIVSKYHYELARSEEAVEVPENPVFQQFFSRNLAECSMIDLCNSRLEVSNHFIDPSQLKTKTGKININSRTCPDFYKILQSILKDGIPSRNPNAEIEILVCNENLDVRDDDWEFPRSCRQNLALLADRVDEPLGQQEILKHFVKSSPAVPLAKSDPFEVAFYRRRASDNVEYLYIFLHLLQGMHFYAKAAPIFSIHEP